MKQTAERFRVKDFGPIEKADITFGDLTILIGPQASGKSLFLELFKLVKDHDHVVNTLKNYNYVLEATPSFALSEYYFGEGLSSLIRQTTKITDNGMDVTSLLTDSLITTDTPQQETVFYVPAQRILSISDGRPKNFMEFDLSTPYPLRFFSETLRVFMQGNMGNHSVIFPREHTVENSIDYSINSSIFHNGKVVMDQTGGQRKMKLDVDGTRLPFMTWSAGQKEFMPLLLAIYCLTDSSPSKVKRNNYKWVIIEEPEMGLHPKAIETVIIEILQLMRLGFKVILSTHSAVFIDFAWTLKELADLDDPSFKQAMTRLFNLKEEEKSTLLFNNLASKNIKTYYFHSKENKGVISTDISSLDVMDNNEIVSEWGGLSSFAGRASEIVSEYGQD